MFHLRKEAYSSKTAGLPPGSLVHVGAKKTEKVSITLIEYDEKRFQKNTFENVEEFLNFQDSELVTKSVRWIHITGLHQTDLIESIGKHYHIHHLILEDILNTHQRPKLEDYEDCLFMVMKMFCHNGDEKISAEQLSLILGHGFVISFQEGDKDVFEPVRKRIKSPQSRFRKAGADYLAYAITDTVVDYYFKVIEEIDERLEAVEEDLFAEFSQKVLQEIHELKREIIFLNKAVLPLRGMISTLEKTDSPLVSDMTHIYIRDLYDHVIRIVDIVETFREMATSLLDIYHSGLSNKMNEIMKVLTLIATIFIPLTFIAGIYGMNFKYMPELEWRWGYPLIWLVIILIVILMITYFRKKNWL
ncbi:MAG: magnesium and cobalt transport protein CorA [Desulfobacteraceae bacterium IS3]|nr:MAG: magnesium and cobalt transport protein CorA [Desulfobacteraceae bacterium IS3]